MVKAPEARGKTRGRIQIGADDPSLTGNGGMLAVTELCARLGLISELDSGIGPVKQRARGFSGGQVLAGMAAAQLAGEDFLVGLTGSARMLPGSCWCRCRGFRPRPRPGSCAGLPGATGAARRKAWPRPRRG